MAGRQKAPPLSRRAGPGALAAAGKAAPIEALPEVRDALDAADYQVLAENPADEDAIADIASDESFPASDAPSNTREGGGEPAHSSGYDEEAERDLADRQAKVRDHAHALWEQEGRPHGRDREHWEQAERAVDAPGEEGAPDHGQ